MAVVVDYAMDLLHDQSLPTIELLQKSFPNSKDLMISISTLFDPRYVFLIYAPILFALNKRVGHRMVLALTLTEWANQILKWLLAGERPYWYVHERAHELALARNATGPQALLAAGLDQRAQLARLADYDAAAPAPPPQLKQFPVTCELGAGSPSGHAMVTATVWYILIEAVLRGELTPFARNRAQPDGGELEAAAATSGAKQTGSALARLSWFVYTLMLLSVSLSRVFLACHFPHQCLGGALLGVAVARLVSQRLPMERLRPAHFCLTTGFMFASALGTYALLRGLGMDPLWSVSKAMRWCAKKEYIHLDTTPFFSMMRYLGFCLGAGLAFNGTKQLARRSTTAGETAPTATTTTTTGGHLFLRRALAAGLAIAFGQALLALPAPKSNLNLFYVISFAIYTLFSYAAATSAPALAKRLLPQTTSSHEKQKAL